MSEDFLGEVSDRAKYHDSMQWLNTKAVDGFIPRYSGRCWTFNFRDGPPWMAREEWNDMHVYHMPAEASQSAT